MYLETATGFLYLKRNVQIKYQEGSRRMELIQMRGIVKSYGKDSAKTDVLHRVDLSIEAGEFICILGKSGCGKTTLLNMIGLLDQANEGEYCLEGVNVADLSSSEIAKIRNQKIGFIFQSFQLLDDYSVLDNVSLPMGYAGVKKQERQMRAKKLLEQVGMTHRLNHYPRQLSGGEKQRVAIARALSNSPGLLLADEPTGSLDEKNGRIIMDILKELNKSGITVILVTHDQSMKKYATRIVEISDGEVVSDR